MNRYKYMTLVYFDKIVLIRDLLIYLIITIHRIKKMKAFILLVTISILFLNPIKSQTTLPASIISNTTLTQANSPYIVSGNVVIFQGVIVNVDPGVEIKIDSYFEIEVRGTLLFNGNSTDSIYVHSSQVGAGNSAWKRINTTPTSTVSAKYLKMSNCDMGIAINYDNSQFTNSRFFNNNYSIVSSGSHPHGLIKNCLFHNNNNCVNIMTADNFWVRKCDFHDNQNAIGRLGSNQQNIHIDSCNIYNNNFGVNAWLDMWGGDITNTNIFNNATVGLELYWYTSTPNHQFVNNLIYNNGTGVLLKAQSTTSFVNTYICNNTVNNVELLYSENADVKNVCWCTNDSATIRSKIKDGYVDNSLGLTYYTPYMQNCSLTTVGIKENKFNEELLSIYPNPVVDLLYITHKENELINTIKIFNVEGKNILNVNELSDNKINVSGLKPGLYMIKFVINGNVYNYKFLKN